MQGSIAHLKLSSINDHHKDKRTDHLYQPLRAAINSSKPAHNLKLSNLNPKMLKEEMKTSQFSMSGQQQTLIKQSTMIPQNMHLIQTINPLKRMRARSRKYRAISVEQTIKKPMDDCAFKMSMQLHPAKKKEVVYDYQPNGYETTTQAETHRKVSISTDYKLPMRSRSTTHLGLGYNNAAPKLTKVQSTNVKVQRKVPQSPVSQTSIKMTQYPSSNPTYPQRQIKTQKQIKIKKKQPEFSNEYYQNAKKYTFNKEFMASPRNQHLHQKNNEKSPTNVYNSPRKNNSGYKYNLFSMLDQQANNRCSTGSCTKNELVASKIQKRW